MSGTSFDGIDLCLSEFQHSNSQWNFSIIKAETIAYTEEWKQKLLQIEKANGENLIQLHFEYGHFLGKIAKDFLKEHRLNADLIASHGHTIFHQIEKGFTFQLGHGASIAASSEIITVADFRSLDVALQGEGAPLVPFGDMHLFGQYSCCLNIGGIANLSIKKESEIIAFDIAPANMVLNHIYQSNFDGDFDIDGVISKTGSKSEDLFTTLNSIDFYHKKAPKSLGKEWVFEVLMPQLTSSGLEPKDLLCTYTHHLVHQISKVIHEACPNKKVLITGGGAKNKFLLQLLDQESIQTESIDENTVDFKEALIFAFLGVTRYLERNNTLKSVTGAKRDSCGGSIFLP